jgi:hypothetical protein
LPEFPNFAEGEILMALNILGAIAGVYFAWYLSQSRNPFAIGGTLVFGFGLGTLVLVILSNSPIKKSFDDRFSYIFVGLLSGGTLIALILAFIYLIDSNAKEASFEDLSLRSGILLSFWLCYLWDKSKKV